jgi:ketosteroid isomerase-like protein
LKDIDDVLARLRHQYTTAVSERNVEALVRLYDPKARIFDAWGVWQYDGIDQWKIAIEGWFSSNPTDRLQTSFAECIVIGDQQLATMTAIVSYAAIAPDGSVSHAMQNRLTWVLRTAGHNLRIIHEHTSAPIGFEDMKAILKKPT